MDELTIDNCSLCGSAQTVVDVKKTVEGGVRMVEVGRRCKMCRRTVPIWSGTENEHKRKTSVERAIQAQLAAWARRLEP